MIIGLHAIVYSKHSDAVRAFLSDVLELPSVDAGGGWLIFALPPAELAVHPAEGGTRHELYLMCDDIHATLADLPYAEDSRAEVDMNVVATDTGTLIEVQGTGEGATFTRSTLDAMLDLALAGCARLSKLQADALAEPYPGMLPAPGRQR